LEMLTWVELYLFQTQLQMMLAHYNLLEDET
jgi:hypothetical protein